MKEGEAAYRALNVGTSGLYEIEARGVTEGTWTDPELTLYEMDSDRTVQMASDDDGGAGLNSRLLSFLRSGTTYSLSVMEVSGSMATIEIRARLVAPSATERDENPGVRDGP